MRKILAGVATLAMVGLVGVVTAPSAIAKTHHVAHSSDPVIYDSTSQVNVSASQGFQCCGTSEFGDAVTFAGSARFLTGVNVEFSPWSVYSNPSTPNGYTPAQAWQGQATGPYPGGGPNPNGATYSDPNGFYWPLTLNLYSETTSTESNINTPGSYPAAGTLLGSVTENALIPWQPEPSLNSTCLSDDQADLGGTVQAWLSPTLGCLFGGLATINFNLSSLPGGGVAAPNTVVWGVAFDTDTWGANPVGVDGPYDSLNVATTTGVTVGTDANVGGAFLDSTEAGEYGSCYSTPNDYSSPLVNNCSTGTFRNDPNGWTGYIPAVQFSAVSNIAPSFTSTNEASATQREPFTFEVTTAGYPVPSLGVRNLPRGLTFTSNHNGTATITGSPRRHGTHVFTLKARNSAGTATQKFTLTISS